MAAHLRLVVDNTGDPAPGLRADDVMKTIGVDALPFHCGVDETGFVNRAVPRDAGGRRTRDLSLIDLEPPRLFVSLCGDCDSVFHARAEIAGTCRLANLFAVATAVEPQAA